MTGSALAGMLSVTFNVTAASIGIGGLPGILSIQPQYMLPFAGTMLVAIVVPMLLTFFFRKAGLLQNRGRYELAGRIRCSRRSRICEP